MYIHFDGISKLPTGLSEKQYVFGVEKQFNFSSVSIVRVSYMVLIFCTVYIISCMQRHPMVFIIIIIKQPHDPFVQQC